MSRRHQLGALVCLAAAIVLPGCVPKCPETHVSLQDLVAEHNANARLIPRLWARAKIQVKLTDAKGRRLTWGSAAPLSAPNGSLLLAKTDDPLGVQDFVLIGRETMAMEVFRLGSSAAEGVYYFWYYYGQDGAAWWGQSDSTGDEGIEGLPIDPNQLLSVLSVCELPENFTEVPTVALNMSQDPCSYVVTYLDRLPVSNRIVFAREVYFNWDKTGLRRPFMVKLFNNDGDRVMIAELRNYQPVASPDQQGGAPAMPTDIRISWPAKGSMLHIILSEMSTDPSKWDISACGFRDSLPGGISSANTFQVDRRAKPGGQGR